MKFNRKLLGAALLLSVGLAGCAEGLRADLSPDGSSVVQASTDGLRLRSTEDSDNGGSGKGRLLARGNIYSPRFSPNGKQIIAWEESKPPHVLFIDAKSGAVRKLGTKIEPPYAWRPDGSEVLGWVGDETAVVFHVASGEIVRKYAVKRPESACWMRTGRDFAVGYADSVSLVKDGRVVSHHAELDSVQALGTTDHRLIWIESKVLKGSPEYEAHLRVRSMDAATGEVSTLRDIDDMGAKLGGRVVLMPSAVSIAPGGHRMAVGAQAIHTTDEIWQRALALDKYLQTHHRDAKAERELMALTDQMKFESVTEVIGLNSDESFVVARSTVTKTMTEWPHDLRWSADGTKLALVMDKTTQVVPVLQ